MAKTLLSFAAATGVAATAAPATFLSSNTGSGTGEAGYSEIRDNRNENPSKPKTPPKPFAKPTWSPQLIPQLTSVGKISSEYQKVGCLREYFGTITWSNQSSADATFNEINLSNNSNTKSCLIIEYYKQTYKNNKWWGEFRLIWSLKDETGKSGLITVIDLSTEKGKLLGNVSAYTLKKNDAIWVTSRSKENNVQGSTGDKLLDLIPRNNGAMSELAEPDYWGFDPSINNICNQNDCSEMNDNGKKHKYYSFEWIGSGGASAANFWSTDVDAWMDLNFKWKKLTDKMYSVMGSWKSRSDWPK